MEQSDPSKPATLTPKQEAFCQEYLKDLNATQAAIRAGYSEDSARSIASEHLTKPNIQARLQQLMDERSERVKLDADYVLSNLMEITERCMQRAPVMVRRGKVMVQLQDEECRDVWRFDSNGANKALELLGKHLKLFTEKHEHTGKDGAPIQFNDHEAAAKLAAILDAARSRKPVGEQS